MFNSQNIGIRASSGGAGGLALPDRSLSFTRTSGQYLTISNSSFGTFDRSKFAVSFWFKRTNTTGAFHVLYSKALGGTQNSFFICLYNDNLYFAGYENGAADVGTLITTATYTSTTNWYHVLAYYDSANATATNRMRLWVDGSEVTSFSVDTAPNNPVFAGTDPVRIAATGAGTEFDGLIYQPAFFSGSLPTIAEVYNAGAAKDISSISGLHSYLHTTNSSTLEDDYILASDWTNNNSVIKNTSIP